MPTYEDRIKHVTHKLVRANEHVDELGRQLEAFLATQPFKVEIRRDTERRPVYFVSAAAAVPDNLALIAGDAIQNLMSTLDHLAYQLVAKDTADNIPNPHWIYFPIADDLESYDQKKQGKMRGANAETLVMIDGLKPYKGGDDHLWSLYRLNNIEKHRLLLTVGAQAAGIHLGQLLAQHAQNAFSPEAISMLKGMHHFLMPAETGFPLRSGFDLYVGGSDEQPNPELQFRFTVALNEVGIAEGKPLLEFIKELADRTGVVVDTLSSRLR